MVQQQAEKVPVSPWIAPCDVGLSTNELFFCMMLTRWVVESRDGEFLGYTGVMPSERAPLGFHTEIGWRLVPEQWGKG